MVLSNFFPSNGGQDKLQSRGMLRWAALFLGELRDGLTMINMQSAYLIISRDYTEKQAGIMFFVFGMSQFLFQTPAGYLYDYTESKIRWLSIACVATTFLTVFTALFAQPAGGNLGLMIFVKFLQGAVTSFIPPGLNSITQGIVGSNGMTSQVSVNEMMNHLGTAIIVLTGSLIGLSIYPNLQFLFVVSPIACAGVLYFLNKIDSADIDHDAARGLDNKPAEGKVASNEYVPPEKSEEKKEADETVIKMPIDHFPSFNLGGATDGAESPLKVLSDPKLVLFILICFCFHTSNGTVLPLVMQTLAIGNGRSGILMSGLCIIVAQLLMVVSAKVCGDYSGKYGRKPLFLIGLYSVPIRCLILVGLLLIRGDGVGSPFVQFLILSTQILDGVGAGVFGTMYILVTSDLAKGTGRFSMILGLTTAAMSIGGTVSGYLGEALAEDLGYKEAFFILSILSLVAAILYTVFMPETLALSEQEQNKKLTETVPQGEYTEMV